MRGRRGASDLTEAHFSLELPGRRAQPLRESTNVNSAKEHSRPEWLNGDDDVHVAPAIGIAETALDIDVESSERAEPMIAKAGLRANDTNVLYGDAPKTMQPWPRTQTMPQIRGA